MQASLPNLEAWRAEFPVLQGDGVYLLNNAMGAMPRGVGDMLARYTDELGRLGEHAWGVWYPWVLAETDRVAAFIGAPAGTVTFDTSVTTLLHRVASCLDFRGERNRVLHAALDFPTIGYAWQGWRRHGAEPIALPSADGIHVTPEAFIEALDERVRVVCLPLATYCSGALVDVRAIADAAHAAGALVVVDAFQAYGVVPIDVLALGADVVISGTRKFGLGAGESAWMYVRDTLIPTLEPVTVGWFAHRDPFAFGPTLEYAEGITRFQAGTPTVLPHYAASVGRGILEAVGMATVRAQSLALTEQLIARADEQGLTVACPREPEARAGVVCLKFPSAEATVRRLNDRGFGCSFRPASGLRVAPHFYNTSVEIDRFMTALADERMG